MEVHRWNKTIELEYRSLGAIELWNGIYSKMCFQLAMDHVVFTK